MKITLQNIEAAANSLDFIDSVTEKILKDAQKAALTETQAAEKLINFWNNVSSMARLTAISLRVEKSSELQDPDIIEKIRDDYALSYAFQKKTLMHFSEMFRICGRPELFERLEESYDFLNFTHESFEPRMSRAVNELEEFFKSQSEDA